MSFDVSRLLRAIEELPLGRTRIMEVCGTHTMAIARSGIKSMLPKNIKLLSGPGCPVCVTPPELIDAVLELSSRPGIVIATYGDMMRVPGSRPGDDLTRRRAGGARVEVVYSPVDAVALAERESGAEVVFLGVGFETTAPGTAAAVLTAKEKGLKNFSVFTMLKTVEPALRALIASEGFNIQGFLCPGHVATIIGERGFEFLPRDFSLPAVISGFEPEDILGSVYLLLRQIAEGRAELQNEYRRAVAPDGNPAARAIMDRCFEPCADIWRGLGEIEGSGLALREELADFDARRRFGIELRPAALHSACRCGEIIKGALEPRDCPLFGKRCTPEDPVGPCMVSSEGACAASYKYQGIE